MVTSSVPVKVIMFELGSLGQGGQFGVKCVNVFRQFYQNWLARLRGELSGDIYDRDPPQHQQPSESWVNIPRNPYLTNLWFLKILILRPQDAYFAEFLQKKLILGIRKNIHPC